MKAFSSITLAAMALWALPVPSLAQQAEYPLSRVASELGYSYNYLGEQQAAVVSRPGLTILVRPGQNLAEVNDQSLSLDAPPRLVEGELYVPAQLVAKMRSLAHRYAAAGTGVQAPSVVVVSQPSSRGAVSLDVRQLSGSFALAVAGKAPPSVPITLTLIGSMSRDIPDVLLSRSEVASDVDGRFQAVVSIAPGFFTDGLLTLVATSIPGVTRASAQVVLKAPNWRTSVPADELPKSVRNGIYP